MGGIHVEHRPERLGEIWGNSESIRTLQNIFKQANHDQTFLFHGTRGCGKTTTARACAKELGVDSGNIEEINIADQRNIDDARALIAGLDFPPLEGKRVYILDECHMANDFWSNALLKSLEEPPSWAYFFLCTTDPQKLKKTIRSRCQEFLFEPLAFRTLSVKVRQLMADNNWELEDIQVSQIVENSEGIPRDALKLLGKVLQAAPDDRNRLLQDSVQESESHNLAQALLKKDIKSAMAAAKDQKAPGAEEKIRRGIMGYMAMLMEKGPTNPQFQRAYEVFYSFKDPFYNQGWPGLIFAITDSIYGG